MDTKNIFDLKNFETQQKSQWCFAAMINMLRKHYKLPSNTQQQIVEEIIRKTTSDGTYNPTSNNRYDPKKDDAQQDPFGYLKEKNMINYSEQTKVIDWDVIREEIDNQRPIIVRIGVESSGHYVLLVGYHLPPVGQKIRNYMNDVILYYIDPNRKGPAAYTEEKRASPSKPNPNEFVTVEYTDTSTGKTDWYPDGITGYTTTKHPSCKGGSKCNKSRKSRKSRVTGKKIGGKWSLKYKKSINCKRPKGFSQKQHCKYGRKK